MLYRVIIAVCSEIHTKHINTLCGQNVEFLEIDSCATEINHKTLKASLTTLINYTYFTKFLNKTEANLTVGDSRILSHEIKLVLNRVWQITRVFCSAFQITFNNI